MFANKNKKVRARDGQILTEALVAVSILTVGFLGMFSLLSQTLGLNRVVTEDYTATYLAAEGIEVVKNLVDAQSMQKKSGADAGFGLPSGCYEITYDTGVGAAVPQPMAICNVDSAHFLYFDPTTEFYNYDTDGSPTTFKRIVQVTTSADGEEVAVNSTVYWTGRGGGNFSINLEDHFMKWETFWR